METLQSTIFIEFDVNTKKITFLRNDNVIDYDSNATSVYVRVKYKNLSGNTIYLTPSELEDYKFSLYTIKPVTNNINKITGKITDELKENVSGGVVKFEIPRACTNRLGIVKCEIHIDRENKKIASSTFVLDIKQSLVTEFDNALLEDEDFPVLRQLILDVQNATSINDTTPSETSTYSSSKIENIKENLNSQISVAYEHSQSTHAPSDAEANVQVDWNETDTTSDSYIKNKPTNLVTIDDIPAVPTKTSQLENDSNFVTDSVVDEKIANAQLNGGEVDLSSYAKITDLPTKTSQLTNDSGYITNIPDEYITEAELNAKGYATTSQIPTIPTNVSQLTNDANYASETYVANKIAEASLNGGDVDLSGYVTKELGNANQITFSDGQTFQSKLDAGLLKGDKGEQGLKGDKGDPGSTEASGVSIQDTAGNFTATNVEGALAELFQSVSNGKTLIASAITDKGVSTSNTATFQEMATNIGNITSTGGDTTQYSVTYNLSNVVSSNTATSVNAGDLYTTTLTANSGYQLNTPVVTVDGIDVTSKYYLNGVFTINNVFGNIIITADATEVITGGDLTLNYTFNNETAGNGYGTISLLANSDASAGTYTIQYADDNGALTNYDNICALATTNGVQADYTHFIKEQMIPKYATKIIAVKDGQTKAEFVIPENKRFTSGNYGQHLYSFGALSDLHCDISTWDTDFQEALTYLNDKESVVFTCIDGDVTNNSQIEEYEKYKTLKETYSPNTPVYATNGNHEWDSTFTDERWDTYMENKRTCLITHGNDVFIMLGTDVSPIFPTGVKQWLEFQLEKFQNCRVFIFCHYFINGTDNGNYSTWDESNELNVSVKPGKWLLQLIQQYKNVFYVSGHSHFKFILQELNPKANVCNEYNSTEIGYLWHLSSITAPADVIDNVATGKLTAQSEGVVVDVYENCILYRARNFVDKKFLPIAQYIIPKVEGVIPDTTVWSVKTTLTKATSSNNVTSVAKNSSYTTTITPKDPYVIKSITVYMGIHDITSTAVSGNTITIDSVTDDLFITVVAGNAVVAGN